MELLNLLQKRRSVRQYTGEHIPEEKIERILQAGLLAMSGRGVKPWEFIVVRDKDVLRKMVAIRDAGANMLAGADAAIVVLADETKTDVWTEDASIAMAYMHLMAANIGLGSCWVQGRLRKAATGETTEEALRQLLGFPEKLRLEAVLSLGEASQNLEAHSLEELLLERIHYEKY